MDSLLRYFPNISVQQNSQFSQLESIYRFWNRKINLISRKDIDNFYEHHVLHSLSIAKFFAFTPGTNILDVGTGGGFPGIPLAIFFPLVNFTLNDSIGKKITTVDEIVKSLNLKNVNTICSRAEDLNIKFDFVVSRAVADFPLFVKWTGSKINPGGANSFPNGIIYLKGGDFEDELKAIKLNVVVHNISEIFTEEFFRTKKIIFYPVEK